jgi:hypothetical protein
MQRGQGAGGGRCSNDEDGSENGRRLHDEVRSNRRAWTAVIGASYRPACQEIADEREDPQGRSGSAEGSGKGCHINPGTALASISDCSNAE